MRFIVASLLLMAAIVASVDEADASKMDEPRQLLERMTAAMGQMSYQGTFVYIQGDRVETIRITHVSDEAGVRERLVAISGPAWEVLRDSSGVRWVLADDQSVFEDAAFDRSFFPELPFDQYDQAEISYTLAVGTQERVAGYKATNLRVLPRDNYRYGYSLWLEKHSGLLLKWELIDSDQQPLATLMFTDVRLGSEVDVDELKPASRLKKFKTVESALPTGRVQLQASPKWKPDRLPPGFRLTAHRFIAESADEVYEHLVYSDGLASVSLYVESEETGGDSSPRTKKLGTTHAYSKVNGGMMITVVGDVPKITVESIGSAVNID
jgi:sigma-E factor negative regulatory protein RseB